jgi:hypothetical protein
MNRGDRLCCSGKVAGLGTASTTVQVTAAFSCVNPAGMQPGELASGESAPIVPRGGQITFTNVCTGEGNCPPPMTPSFGGSATINIFQGGNLVFSATIRSSSGAMRGARAVPPPAKPSRWRHDRDGTTARSTIPTHFPR